MKLLTKKYVTLASVASGFVFTSLAMAGNVANTKHNLSFSGVAGSVYKSNDPTANQVCVFCHTPHNAGKARTLWNKANNSAIDFRLYTSSGTLTNVVRKQSTLPADSPSLLCLSCHDGKTAINILHSSSFGEAAPATANGYPAGSKMWSSTTGGYTPVVLQSGVTDMFTGLPLPSMGIGGSVTGANLTDDHPIGFSYSDAQIEKQKDSNGLHPIGTVTTNNPNIRFFGKSNRMECSTCHDPHVDSTTNPAQKPFLVQSNAQSSLCLACHNK
jgi:hypothetical protein